jgi:hypothetical protein
VVIAVKLDHATKKRKFSWHETSTYPGVQVLQCGLHALPLRPKSTPLVQLPGTNNKIQSGKAKGRN